MTQPRNSHVDSAGSAAATVWDRQWQQVPESWRTLHYRIDAAPFDAVFVRNQRYLNNPDGHDFTPADVPERFRQEMAWWVWLCGHEGIRKIEPFLLKWTAVALTDAAAEHQQRYHRPPVSIADLAAEDVVRHAVVRFERRNARLPSAGARRQVVALIEHLHLYVSVRCTDAPWWAHDIWDLRADPRIPQREHEPSHDQVVKLAAIHPPWLREGVRFWLRTSITAELLRWSSVADRARNMARHLGPFLAARNISTPLLADDRAALRLLFTEFSNYLKSPSAQFKPDRPLSASAVDSTQSQAQVFYAFMVDHAEEAAAATGDPRWAQITDTYTRLWGAAFRTRRANRQRELTWFSTSELQQMLCYLDVLAADRGMPVAITHPDATISVVAGLGDPQAARVWLLQALTGRRASEILMLDFDPLTAIPGPERPTDSDDPNAFVAKLRYQQTKVDGVLPSILVEKAVVNVITEQQQWVRRRYPGLSPKYLFLGLRHQHQGHRARTYQSYGVALNKLDKVHGLADSAGRPLRFSQTHRLRHTRATELLNDGVPIHVVQRYLGHASPEMTLRYAATLAATAESEFLRHKKVGAHGTDIAISPSDIYDMTQLAARTDRVLPNGVCLLPPLKSCDKGNACLSCGHFATDATHLDELIAQRAKTVNLIEVRREQYRRRSGRELTDDNVWIHERRREIASLDAIIERLHTDTEGLANGASVGGAGASNRLPLLKVKTRGSHESVLRKADPNAPG
ncbi:MULTISPECIES: tyrosine-type recombinase/integrase [Mycobacteriaceae]|uniref:Transposase n=7 Tax=Mycobacteriaceae TaxID=1762 RepID=A0A1A2EFY2_MYCSD|nr:MULTISPECIES: tyrosine-type recombinase/integrase [Mycobacteriaceae]MDD7812575.1 tyrosine-type recombinase/integrase [Mycobacterium sp. CSUR Q5927]MEB3022226.1 tyrosine-type recombinase/integrase [Mycolicibacter sp. MYC098]MEB3035115.1 tyrosine-type recombinase/integrase [Mycolicibacter sp. MYC340]OBG00823.1 transposase [Mycolicibacter sinensis]OBG02980.1 transposase [Mycolicibacter sinensis]